MILLKIAELRPLNRVVLRGSKTALYCEIVEAERSILNSKVLQRQNSIETIAHHFVASFDQALRDPLFCPRVRVLSCFDHDPQVVVCKSQDLFGSPVVIVRQMIGQCRRLRHRPPLRRVENR